MRAYTNSINELQAYIKEYHTTGLAWNAGVSLSLIIVGVVTLVVIHVHVETFILIKLQLILFPNLTLHFKVLSIRKLSAKPCCQKSIDHITMID